MKLELSDKAGTTLWATACFCSSLFIFAPSSLFLINQASFLFDFKELLFCLIPLAFFFTLALSLPLLRLGANLQRRIAVLLVALSLLVWIQREVMGWPYGPLNHGAIPWEAHRIQGVIDAVIWITVIALCVIRPSFFYSLTRWVARILILTQLASFTISAFQTREGGSDFFIKNLDQTAKFNFSKNKNVIVLVLDSFQSDIFQEIVDRENRFKDVFDGFTYFRNSLAAFSRTEFAVPAILTGKFYNPSESLSVFLKGAFLGGSLPKVLKEHDFEVDLFPWGGSSNVYIDETIASNFKKSIKGRNEAKLFFLLCLFDYTMFRILPGPVKKHIHDHDGGWLLSGIYDRARMGSFGSNKLSQDFNFFVKMANRAQFKIEKNVFKFFHLQGMHDPLWLNEKMGSSPGIEPNKKNYSAQAKGYLILCETFLEALKQKKAYDNCLILIIGDHGSHLKDLQVGTEDFSYEIARATPLMLVKPFGSSGPMKVSDAPVSGADIPKTVMSALKIRSDFPGINMLERNYNIDRKRSYGRVNEGATGKVESIAMLTVSGFSWLTGSWHDEGVLFPQKTKGFSKSAGK